MKKVLRYFLVFVFLFLMNIFIFKILATLGFQLTMSEKSYIVPPLFSIIVLYMIDKRIRNKKKWIYILGRTFVLPIFYPKSAVGREIGAFGEEVQFLFEDWGKIGIIRWVYTLRKSLQTTSMSPCRVDVTDFVSSIYNLKAVLWATCG